MINLCVCWSILSDRLTQGSSSVTLWSSQRRRCWAAMSAAPSTTCYGRVLRRVDVFDSHFYGPLLQRAMTFHWQSDQAWLAWCSDVSLRDVASSVTYKKLLGAAKAQSERFSARNSSRCSFEEPVSKTVRAGLGLHVSAHEGLVGHAWVGQDATTKPVPSSIILCSLLRSAARELRGRSP